VKILRGVANSSVVQGLQSTSDFHLRCHRDNVDRGIPESVVMRCEDSVSHLPNSSKTHSELVALYLWCCRSCLKIFWGVEFERMMIGCRGTGGASSLWLVGIVSGTLTVVLPERGNFDSIFCLTYRLIPSGIRLKAMPHKT
jgi:hypothetical protein